MSSTFFRPFFKTEPVSLCSVGVCILEALILDVKYLFSAARFFSIEPLIQLMRGAAFFR
jgi:hypothetical protein